MSKPHKSEKRRVDLSLEDLSGFPVWKYSRDGEVLTAIPLSRVPVKTLSGKLAATKLGLASGAEVWCLAGNLGVDERKNQQFATFAFHREGQWFPLARYHDFDYDERGPQQLAAFLGLAVGEVFPFTYDVRALVQGGPPALRGRVAIEPPERLNLD